MAEWEVLPPEEPQARRGSGRPLDRRTRLRAAFVVAVVSDLLSVGMQFAPPLQWTLDIATALALFVILGRQWLILPALMAEAVPGLAAFPVWVLVVLSIAMFGTVRPGGPFPR